MLFGLSEKERAGFKDAPVVIDVLKQVLQFAKTTEDGFTLKISKETAKAFAEIYEPYVIFAEGLMAGHVVNTDGLIAGLENGAKELQHALENNGVSLTPVPDFNAMIETSKKKYPWPVQEEAIQ